MKAPSLLDFITDLDILKLVKLRLASKSLKIMYIKSWCNRNLKHPIHRPDHSHWLGFFLPKI